MLKNPLISLFFLFYSLCYFGQTSVGIATVTVQGEKDIDDYALEQLAAQLLSEISDSVKFELNKELKKLLENELTKSNAFHFSFENIKSFTVLTPKDSTFRLFNWRIPLSDGTYRYECALLKPTQEEKPFDFLSSSVTLPEKLEYFSGSMNQWIGAQYYDIVESKSKFQTYYTLLAWDGNDLLTNKKMIEVLWFDKEGNTRFGAPIFKSNNETKSRVVFEYNGQQSMMLQYEKNLNRITFDHLAPPNSSLTGVYEYYGADFTYDTYEWNGSYWKLISEVYPESSDPKQRTEAKVSKKTKFNNSDAVDKKNSSEKKRMAPYLENNKLK